MLILASLLTASEAGDTMPPQRPVPVSISALARRFSVSRPHVLKLIRDAATEGLIERAGPNGDRVVIRPRLSEAAQNFFATMYLLFADCARDAKLHSARFIGAARGKKARL
jgi:DNA-binding GntR family transcriptional regulator